MVRRRFRLTLAWLGAPQPCPGRRPRSWSCFRHEALGTHMLVAFVAAGVGVTLVPESVETFQVEGVAFRALAGSHPQLPLVSAWTSYDDSPILRNFLTMSEAMYPTVDETDEGH